MTSDILGVVLAGGDSRRMGLDKATLRLAGRTLVERAVAVLNEVFGEVVVAPGGVTEPTPAWRTVADRYPGRGPLAGLEAALSVAGQRGVFLLACDLPRVDARVVRRIVEHAGTVRPIAGRRAWLASEGGRVQPLCGLYAAATIDAVREQLDAGRLDMRGLVSRLEAVGVPVDDLGRERLLNCNRQEDLARAEELLDEP